MPYGGFKSFEQIPVASAARTASGNSGTLDWLQDIDVASFILDSTAVSGTAPTLDVMLQVSPDDGTTFYDWQAFARQTAAGTRRLSFANRFHAGEAAAEAAVPVAGTASATNLPMSRKYRIRWVIGGTTPSFTFSVSLVGTKDAVNYS